MFSKELENLIQATLEDGILEEYEKVALQKRAQAEGVDLTELEIYINSIMQKRKKESAKEENAKQAVIDQQKKESFGRVCPNCGKQVPTMTLKCECGYEFNEQKQISSAQLLAEKLEKITAAHLKDTSSRATNHANQEFSIAKELLGSDALDELDIKEAQKKEIINVISMFPVPNNKEDIIEFVAMSIPNARIAYKQKQRNILGKILHSIIDSEEMDVSKAWLSKYEQVMIKARSMRGDSDFQKQLDYFENLLNKK